MSVRPANVRIGIALFSLDLLLMLRGLMSILLLTSGLDAPLEYDPEAVAFQAVPFLVGVGTLGCLWAGLGGARGGIVALLGYSIIALAGFFLNFHIEMLPFSGLFWTLRVLAESGALFFLFRQDSREWFARCLASRIERRTGIPQEDQAGLPRHYWGAFALGTLALGWGAYPVNVIILTLGADLLELFHVSTSIGLLLMVNAYSGLLFVVGSAAGWIFDMARGANHTKQSLTQQRID